MLPCFPVLYLPLFQESEEETNYDPLSCVALLATKKRANRVTDHSEPGISLVNVLHDIDVLVLSAGSASRAPLINGSNGHSLRRSGEQETSAKYMPCMTSEATQDLRIDLLDHESLCFMSLWPPNVLIGKMWAKCPDFGQA